jgi:hypothetical protein
MVCIKVSSAIESEIVFGNCVHGLIIYIFSVSIYVKSRFVVTFWRHGFSEKSDVLRLSRKALHKGAPLLGVRL